MNIKINMITLSSVNIQFYYWRPFQLINYENKLMWASLFGHKKEDTSLLYLKKIVPNRKSDLVTYSKSLYGFQYMDFQEDDLMQADTKPEEVYINDSKISVRSGSLTSVTKRSI